MVKDHSDSDSKRRNLQSPHELAARNLLYAPSHSFYYTSCGVLAGTGNNSNGSTMKDRSNDPSHHKQTLLSQSYISLL